MDVEFYQMVLLPLFEMIILISLILLVGQITLVFQSETNPAFLEYIQLGHDV